MFTSYAQNFEDVMLWRVFKDVPNGFYIDIGAQEPVIDSVSFGFYEHGWRGVHVEPTPYYADKLRKMRPDEEVVQAAVGSGDTKITFYSIPDTGLSTADPVLAEKHRQRGFDCRSIDVELITLDALLDRFGDRTVHWLKIDVEGLEESVLSSWQASNARPRVVVIESTDPLTNVRTDHKWNSHLFSRGYRFCYFDGLNCFYVHEDAGISGEILSVPPNVFDDFVLSGTSTSGMLARVRSNLRASQAEAEGLQDTNSILEATVADLTNQVYTLTEARLADLEREIELRRQNDIERAEKDRLVYEIDALKVGIKEKEMFFAEEKGNLLITLDSQKQLYLEHVEWGKRHEASLRSDMERLHLELDQSRSEILNLKNSFSWKITAPYRAISSGIQKIWQAVLRSPSRLKIRIKQSVKRFLQIAIVQLRSRPKLFQSLKRLVLKFPILSRAAIKILVLAEKPVMQHGTQTPSSSDFDRLASAPKIEIANEDLQRLSTVGRRYIRQLNPYQGL